MRWLLVVAMALPLLLVGCQNELSAPERVGWLQEKLDEKMVALAAAHPATEQDAARYRAAIAALDARGGDVDREGLVLLTSELPRSLPTLRELLRSEDPELRAKAVRPLSLMLHGVDARALEPALEPALLMVLLAAADTERPVRLRAASFAGEVLHHARSSQAPLLEAEVKEAALVTLRYLASSDPDETVRDVAQRELYKLGQGPPPESGIME